MYLGIDFGSVRVGVAVSDDAGVIAVPHGTIGWSDPESGWRDLAALVAERQPVGIIVGFPKHLSGREGEAAANVRIFAEHLEAEFQIPVTLWDERLSTVQAERMLHMAGMKSKAQRKHIDAQAAAILLQSWLDWRQMHSGKRAPAR